jgi:hypothetical protein
MTLQEFKAKLDTINHVHDYIVKFKGTDGLVFTPDNISLRQWHNDKSVFVELEEDK